MMRTHISLLVAVCGIVLLHAAPSSRPAPLFASGRWTGIGPRGIVPQTVRADDGTDRSEYNGDMAGRIRSIALAPNGDVFAASAGGGVWKFHPGGTWEALTDNEETLVVGAVGIAPSDARFVYAGTGEGGHCYDCRNGRGVLRSTDAGASWNLARIDASTPKVGAALTETCSDASIATTSVAVDPHDAKRVWLGTASGLYTTRDGADHWVRNTCRPISDVKAVSGSNGTQLIAGTPQGIMLATVSRDDTLVFAAPSFEKQALPSRTSASYNVALAVAPSDASRMYAAYANSGFEGGFGCLAAFLTSNDGGATWKAVTKPPPDYFSTAYAYGGGTECFGWYANVLAVSPVNPNVVVAGGTAAVWTTDGGASCWDSLSKRFGIHPDQHALAFARDGSLYVGNDGGAIELVADAKLTAPCGSRWRDDIVNHNADLVTAQFYPGASQYGDGAFVMAGTQDNGTISIAPAAPSSGKAPSLEWSTLAGGDGGATWIDTKTSPPTLIMEFPSGEMWKQPPSAPWQQIGPPVDSTKSDFIMPYAFDPSKPSVIYAAGDQIYRSEDGGIGWSPQTTIVFPHMEADQRVGTAITLTIGTPRAVFGGRRLGRLEYTLDADAVPQVWLGNYPAQLVDVRSPAMDFGRITTIASDPSTWYHLYVGMTSADGRTSWLLETDDIRALPGHFRTVTTHLDGVNKLLVTPEFLIAGCDNGVYAAPRGIGQTWKPLRDGLPNVSIADLLVTENGSIIAFSHGRGAWMTEPLGIKTTPAPQASAAASPR